jgi:predicted dehydrogenase
MKNTYNISLTASTNRSPNCSDKQKKRKLKFGIVGAGTIAQAYVQAFELCEEAEVVGVADISAEAAGATAKRLRCRSYEDYNQMARECDLDAVIICTPPVTHPDICICFLKKQIHVLCEKPLSINLQLAQEMVITARKAGVKLAMASKFRYVEDVVRAKRIVDSGALGDLILCENVFTSHVDMSARWNSIPEISGGGVLIDNGTHSIDLMRYFLGPLARVHVLEGKRSAGLRVEETVVVFVRSATGVIGSIDLSWIITKERDSYLDIYGSRGTLSIGWKQSKYLDHAHGEWVVFGSGYNKLAAFRSQIENFSRAIRGEEVALITDEDALASVSVVETAYAALRQNQWISVNGHWTIPDVQAEFVQRVSA